MKNIRIIQIRFNAEIAKYEIPAFRGAIADKAGHEHILFHNHQKDGQVIYKYPSIQYKRMGRYAGLMCIEDGVDEIHHFFQKRSWDIRIGNKDVELKVDSLNMNQFTLRFLELPKTYSIRDWIALSKPNYTIYSQLEDSEEKIKFLERMLIGNIIAFGKGVKWDITEEIKVEIIDLKEPHSVKFKGNNLLGFDVLFKTNVFLPNWIGLGKGVSHGLGNVREEKQPNNK